MLKGGLGGMMKKAQEMQQNMQRMQQELAHKHVVGEAGAGLVQIKLNGHYGCEQVILDAQLFDEEPEMIASLLAAAINSANQKVRELTQQEMSNITGGINLPEGFKMPF